MTGPLAVGVRVDIHLGRNVLAVDIDATAVKVEWSGERVVAGKLTYECPLEMLPDDPHDPLNNFGQRSHVVALVETSRGIQEVDLGWWLHTSWEEAGDHVTVTALDLMQVLEDDPMPWPSSPATGATVSVEAQRLSEHLPVTMEPGTPDPGLSPLIQWGTSRTEAIRDLCLTHGLAYGVKADGCLHIWQASRDRNPVAAYTGRDLLIDAPRKALERRPNRWIVTGSPNQDKDAPPIRWTGTSVAEISPYDHRLYGWVTDHREFSSATSEAAVKAASENYKQEALSTRGKRSVEIVTDHRLEYGDIIAVHMDHGEVLVGRVIAYSMPVDDPGSVMRVDLEEVLW
ncbi:hypothetical protein NSA19_00980 [Actinomyces bowdenii]|uniref:hypothetical protein n=1 Tax=Actinomyces bowdenii TaxID=131109 RepID=UPI00214AB4AA|nr:hypothetical protein [Actinomyces bowdenii]MCR2051450.1 hypothetical protein [Actinomyces bowdenii]